MTLRERLALREITHHRLPSRQIHSARRLPTDAWAGPYKREGRIVRALRRLRLLPKEAP